VLQREFVVMSLSVILFIVTLNCLRPGIIYNCLG